MKRAQQMGIFNPQIISLWMTKRDNKSNMLRLRTKDNFLWFLNLLFIDFVHKELSFFFCLATQQFLHNKCHLRKIFDAKKQDIQ